MMKSCCLFAMGYIEHVVASSGAKWIYGSPSQLLQKSPTFCAICFFTMCFFRVFAKLRMCCSCCKLILLHLLFCFVNMKEDFPIQVVNLLSSLIVFAWSTQFLSKAWYDASFRLLKQICQRLYLSHLPHAALHCMCLRKYLWHLKVHYITLYYIACAFESTFDRIWLISCLVVHAHY